MRAALVGLLLLAPAPVARAVTSRGDLPILVVLANFPDRPLAHDRAYFAGLIDRLVAYFTEVSAGRLRIVPHIGGPIVTLPKPRASYVQRPPELAQDAGRGFKALATDPADVQALSEAEGLIVFFAGPGRESHVAGGDPGDPWSNYTSLVPPIGRMRDACVIAEEEVPPFSVFGVLVHEFGHLLGLPELYAPGAATHEGIGVWGLMGQGTWLGRGDHPPHLEAWSKARLGWIDVETIDRTTPGVTLPAVTRAARAIRIPVTPGNTEEYYLLENRMREGADSRLPGEGLLVWHVDDRVQGFRSAQRDPAHKLLHLVEADGRGDLDRGHAAGGNRGDAGDPWRGLPVWRIRLALAVSVLGAVALAAAAVAMLRRRRPLPIVLGVAAGAVLVAAGGALRRGPVCGPEVAGMAPYDGTPARVTIRPQSPPGPEMRLDIEIAPPVASP